MMLILMTSNKRGRPVKGRPGVFPYDYAAAGRRNGDDYEYYGTYFLYGAGRYAD